MGQSPQVVRVFRAQIFFINPETRNIAWDKSYCNCILNAETFARTGNANSSSRSRAEFFALQISGYAKATNSFVRDSDQAAQLIWAAACALLEASLLVGILWALLITHSLAQAMPKSSRKLLPSSTSLAHPFQFSCATIIYSMQMKIFECR